MLSRGVARCRLKAAWVTLPCCAGAGPGARRPGRRGGPGSFRSPGCCSRRCCNPPGAASCQVLRAQRAAGIVRAQPSRCLPAGSMGLAAQHASCWTSTMAFNRTCGIALCTNNALGMGCLSTSRLHACQSAVWGRGHSQTPVNCHFEPMGMGKTASVLPMPQHFCTSTMQARC